MLGDVGTAADVDVHTRALDDEEPLVGAHAAWALVRLAARADDSADGRAPAPPAAPQAHVSGA